MSYTTIYDYFLLPASVPASPPWGFGGFLVITSASSSRAAAVLHAGAFLATTAAVPSLLAASRAQPHHLLLLVQLLLLSNCGNTILSLNMYSTAVCSTLIRPIYTDSDSVCTGAFEDNP